MKKYKTYSLREQQFLLFSTKERLLLQDFWRSRGEDFTFQRISKVEDKEKYDAIICSGNTEHPITYLTEVKVRTIPSTKYKSGSKIMKHKWDFLTQSCIAAAEEGQMMQPLYIVFYTDNKVAVFNLCNVDPKWVTRYGHINSSTTSANPIVPQQEFDIPLSAATWYDAGCILNKDYNQLAIEVCNFMFAGNSFAWNRLAE